MLDKSKTIRQEQGITTWRNAGCMGTLNYVMRFGKTRIIELVVQRTLAKYKDREIILLVPTDIAYKNVEYIVKKYHIQCYTLTTVANILEEKKLDSYLLIIDEIHRFVGEKAINVIKSIKFKYTLGLTGSTLSRDSKTILARTGFPVIDIITEEEAIANNWISDYDEYNVAIDIADNEKRHYKMLSEAITNISSNFSGLYIRMNNLFKIKYFKGDYELIRCLYIGYTIRDKNFNKIGYIEADILRKIVAKIHGYEHGGIITNNLTRRMYEFWNPDNIEELAKTYIKCVNTRNDYLKHNVSKVNAVLDLTNVINKPTIIFNDSIDMIDQLYNTIKGTKVKYHSAIDPIMKRYDNGEIITYLSGDKQGQPRMFGATTQKKDAIESLNNGTVQFLITGKSLNESLNIPSIEYIICSSGDTNATTYDQRVARGKTIDDNNSSKKCTIINLFIDDFTYNEEFILSRDKQKLVTRQENVKNVIWIENISDMICTINNKHISLHHERR